MRYAVFAILAVVLVGATPALVLAQQPDEKLSPEERARRVEQLAGEGAQAYRAGDFDKAIELFERGYQVEPVPNLLYNIAKSYERQEKYEKAVEYYQRFIVAPEVDSEARQAALDRIDRLREIADLKDEDIERAEQRARKADDRDEGGHTEPEEPGEASGSSNSTAFWAMGGGAVLIGGGALFGLLATSSADVVKNGGTFEQRKAARDSAKTQALVADGLFVAGAAVSAVGLYLYFSGDDAEAEPTASTTTVTPWVTGHSAGLGMSLDF